MSTAATTHASEPGALRWYRWLVWAGIFANLVVGIVSIAYTAQVLALARVDPATPLVWPRLSAMLVMLLAGSTFPPRSILAPTVLLRSSRWFAGSRAPSSLAVAGGHYIIFALFDFIFGAPRAICLYLGLGADAGGCGGERPAQAHRCGACQPSRVAVFAGGALFNG